MSIKLSICIPTYNRGAFIEETLRSALAQATPQVEVVVSDNASTDDTQEIVRRLAAAHGNIKYFRWDKNMGADANYLKVVEVASGEYCWLMGSDDRLEPQAVSRMLRLLAAHPELAGASVNAQSYDPQLDKRIYTPPPTHFEDDHEFTDAGECFAALGAWYGYLSAQIVNRDTWNAVVRESDLRPYHNAYVHVYVIARMLQRKPSWMYVAHPSVGWRSGNDSFLAEGRLRRLAIDVIGYEQITGDVFGRDSAPYAAIMNTVATVHVKSALLGAKAKAAPTSFFVRALKLCLRYYWRFPRFWLQTFPVFCMPRFVYLGVRALYRVTLKPARLRRVNSL